MSANPAIPSPLRSRIGQVPAGDFRHKASVLLAWAVAITSVASVVIYGWPYYTLDLASRSGSALHAEMRPSGSIGLKLGIVGLSMFAALFVYAIRKRIAWLGKIGKTKRWLDFHVLFGITAPLLITLHSSFKLRGLAGLAYWIMIAVAVSGFIGRYLYAQIPRSLTAAELGLRELEAESCELAQQLEGQALLNPGEIAPLLSLPSQSDVAEMSLGQALWTMFLLDISRPFLVGRLRRRFLSPFWTVATFGGLFSSGNLQLEAIVLKVRAQSWISAKMLFLTRIQEVFHLWHVVHRPFSYSFAVLVVVHITVAMLFGYY